MAHHGQGTGAAPRRAPSRLQTVRARILGAVLALAALGLIIAGGVAYTAQRAHVDDRMDQSLTRSLEEFEALAHDGVHPSTGERFTSSDDLVNTAMRQTVPAPHEGMVGFRGGRTQWIAATPVPLRLEDDEALMEELEPYTTGRVVVLRQITTPETSYRVLVIPVTDGDVPSALVLAFDRSAEHAEFDQVFRTYAIIAVVALLLIAAVGWLVAGRLLRPVRLLGQTARRISDTHTSERLPVTGNDDVSDLTHAFNEMLDRLAAAFDAEHELLDDVGHELRTPLTIVRGHLELMDPEDPEDAGSTRDLALDELDRMHRLVDDLMTLATAGSPGFVRLEETDLGRLTDDILDKARLLGDRRWTVDARTGATANVDEQRLTQAWLQLASNAVKFSAPGSKITLGSAVRDGRIRLWVRDEGIGVSPDQLERIFVRFAQAERDPAFRDGAGLGLAIVSAIAGGHEGRVEVSSTRGFGSTFTLDLPLEPGPNPPAHEPDDLSGASGSPLAPRSSPGVVAETPLTMEIPVDSRARLGERTSS
ncbi:HAMP domain-containing histidine kinase [Oerskovia sp. Sa1BUA8]|uniref:histidine kinase n=1 Tax=Oerskovia douganii TaxID=2762210 RepID=A0A9D5UAE1_9CELL|nr:HAMP domain-containing sensor histidine kinase [Oerskovia douganii]MBE7699321.1 HAMP domain-containing histidine kinase [Oerskovia douganii]